MKGNITTKLLKSFDKDKNKPATSKKNSKKDVGVMLKEANTSISEVASIVDTNVQLREHIEAEFARLQEEKEKFDQEITKAYSDLKVYQDEVAKNLEQKKQDIETELLRVEKEQHKLSLAREKFETTKRNELNKIKMESEKQKNILNSKEQDLHKYDSDLRIERNKLEAANYELNLERLKFEAEKQELETNLSKFNFLVNGFTGEMKRITDEDGE